jgi:hypothetical protein
VPVKPASNDAAIAPRKNSFVIVVLPYLFLLRLKKHLRFRSAIRARASVQNDAAMNMPVIYKPLIPFYFFSNTPFGYFDCVKKADTDSRGRAPLSGVYIKAACHWDEGGREEGDRGNYRNRSPHSCNAAGSPGATAVMT